MPQKLCLVCGSEESEVKKMHYFPSNPERSKVWQENMCMKYMVGVSFRNYRICCRHFTVESYANYGTSKLHADAVPTLFPCHPLHDPSIATQSSNGISVVEKEIEISVISDPLPSTSTTAPGTPPNTFKIRKRTSVFRGICNISDTPRKRRLMRMVENKESHIRKLKKICKQRANNMKDLCHLNDSPVVRNLFHGMPSSTADFLISQLPTLCKNKSKRKKMAY